MSGLPIAARRVSIVYPCRRCCATGCGDKIKGLDDDYMCWEVVFDDGSVGHLEDDCVDDFVNGHPDYGFPHGGRELFEGKP